MAERTIITSSRQRGFTLVELLVALTIIAFAAGIAVLNAPPARDSAQAQAEQFAAKLKFAGDAAILNNVLIGIEMSDGAADFYRYFRGSWEPYQSAKLTSAVFNPDVAVEFEIVEAARQNEENDKSLADAETPTPTVFFSPTGETTPLRAKFRTRRGEYSVEMTNSGKVTVVLDEKT